MSDRTEIRSVLARRVWNSRGLPTLEVEVGLAGGSSGRGIAPSGASTGRFEVGEARDRHGRVGGQDVMQAIEAMPRLVMPALTGLDGGDQQLVDRRLMALLEQHPEVLGGNLIIATSLAVLQAAAASSAQPLWRMLSGVRTPTALPRPQIQIIGGGAHAAGRLDLQDLMVVPLGDIAIDEALLRIAEVQLATRRLLDDAGLFGGFADEGGFWPCFGDNDEALGWLTRGIEAAGFRPGEDMALSVDVAASQLADADGYLLRLEDRHLDVEAWTRQLLDWTRRWPIRLLEDPFRETAIDACLILRSQLDDSCAIVGDDLVATDPARIETARSALDAVLIKPNQSGTVSGAAAALQRARACELMPIASARSGETEDTSIVDLAVGWEMPMLKVGALARGERTAKWNSLLRISEQLGYPPLADIG